MAIVVALAILAIYFFMAGRSTLWDRDEPAFARATVEMVQSGNYLYPTFNGRLRADKPILIYWLMSIPVRILGQTELACRFWSPIGTAVACLLIYFIGRRLFDRRTGLLAMVIYGLVPLTAMIGTAATADAVMIAFNLGVLAVAAVVVSTNAFKWWHWAVMAALFGGALLTKSAFGVMPLMAIAGIAGFSLLSRNGKPIAEVARKNATLFGLCTLAAIVGGLIFLAWFIPANSATGGEFFTLHFGKHVANRATSPMVGHGGGGWTYFLYLPYYLVVLIPGLFPWTLFLPGAISAVLGGRIGGSRGRAFLVGWVVFIFVPITVVVTKFPHYALMFVPALALALAGAIRATEAGRLTDRDRKWLKIGVWVFAPVAVAMILGGFIGPWFPMIAQTTLGRWFPKIGSILDPWLPPSRTFVLPGLAIGLISAAMAGLAMRFFRSGRLRHVVLVLAAGMVLLQLAVAGLAVPAVELLKVSAPIARAINAATPRNVPVDTCGYSEPSLNFYLDRLINQDHVKPAKPGQPANPPTPLTPDEAAAWLKQSGPGVLVITREALDAITAHGEPIPTREIAAAKGFNYSNAKWIELVALRRE